MKTKEKHSQNHSSIIRFRRWSRKGFAIFASLHKEVQMRVVFAGLSLIILSNSGAKGQTTTPVVSDPNYDLDEIIIQESAEKPAEIAWTTDVVSKQESRTLPAGTLEDFLQQSPVIDLRQRGSQGVQADISLKGGSYDQQTILLNGINFTDPRTGHQSGSLPIDPEILTRIEIRSNDNTMGTLTGAINFITEKKKQKTLEVNLNGGSYGYLYGNLWAGYNLSGTQVNVMGSYRRSDGYQLNTDFQTLNLFLNTNTRTSRHSQLVTQWGYQKKDFGANGFYSASYPNQYEQTATCLGSIQWRLRTERFSLEPYIAYRSNRDIFDLFRPGTETPDTYSGANRHHSQSISGGVKMGIHYQIGETHLIVNEQYDLIYSNVLGVRMPEKKGVYTHSKNRNGIEADIVQNFSIQRFLAEISAGIHYSSYGWLPKWNIALAYSFTPNLSLSIMNKQNGRLPTFTDLYYTTPTHSGNDQLQPEKAITTEVGVRYNKKKLFAETSVFYRKTDQLIDWVRYPDQEIWQAKQITQMNTWGWYIGANYSLNKYVPKLSLSYTYMQKDKNSGSYVSKYAMDYLRHKATAQLIIAPLRNLNLSINGVYRFRNEIDNQTGGIFTLDAKVSYQLKQWEFYVQASNLTNTKYSDYMGIPQPGIWPIGGIRFKL